MTQISNPTPNVMAIWGSSMIYLPDELLMQKERDR